MSIKFLGAVVAAGLFASAAGASTVNVTQQVSGNSFGSENLYRSVTISSPGPNGSIRAGMFQLTGDNGFGDFSAFCVDLYENLALPHAYQTSATRFTAPIMNAIDRLFTSAYASVDTATEAAGFQVALWEVIYDNASLDVSSGAFSVSGNAAVAAQANAYLSGLGTETGGYDLTFLNARGVQDLVTGTPATVPLPASGMLLLAGLGGVAAARRRGKKA